MRATPPGRRANIRDIDITDHAQWHMHMVDAGTHLELQVISSFAGEMKWCMKNEATCKSARGTIRIVGKPSMAPHNGENNVVMRDGNAWRLSYDKDPHHMQLRESDNVVRGHRRHWERSP